MNTLTEKITWLDNVYLTLIFLWMLACEVDKVTIDEGLQNYFIYMTWQSSRVFFAMYELRHIEITFRQVFDEHLRLSIWDKDYIHKVFYLLPKRTHLINYVRKWRNIDRNCFNSFSRCNSSQVAKMNKIWSLGLSENVKMKILKLLTFFLL